MSDLKTTIAPGWYSDPAAPDQLRLWDGLSWTTHVRSDRQHLSDAWPSPEPVAPDNDRSKPRSERAYAGLILTLLVTVFAAAGLYEVVLGTSSGKTSPGRFAADATTLPAPAAVTAAGTGPEKCADAAGAIRWLASRSIPAAETPDVSQTSAWGAASRLACSHAVFTDARDAGPQELWAYPSAGIAARVVATGRAPAGVAFASGAYVVYLDGRLSRYRASYETALASMPVTETSTPALLQSGSRPSAS